MSLFECVLAVLCQSIYSLDPCSAKGKASKLVHFFQQHVRLKHFRACWRSFDILRTPDGDDTHSAGVRGTYDMPFHLIFNELFTRQHMWSSNVDVGRRNIIIAESKRRRRGVRQKPIEGCAGPTCRCSYHSLMSHSAAQRYYRGVAFQGCTEILGVKLV